MKESIIKQINIKIRANIFPGLSRPPKFTVKNGYDGFGIMFHYPNQLSSPKQFLKFDWPSRQENESTNYHMWFQLKNMEVVENRNKLRQSCVPGLPNIDFIVNSRHVFRNSTCKPYYLNTFLSNLTFCKTKEKLKKLHKQAIEARFSGKCREMQPCRTLEQLEFDYAELDNVEGDVKDPFITISIIFLDTKYREILNIRAFDANSLFGNIGGYVGIFIGYALLHIPDAIINFINKMKNKDKNCNKISGPKEEHCMEDVLHCRMVKIEEELNDLKKSMGTIKGERQ